jgi:flagellum-specific peptidoglycan hydrolase FlgJ
MTVLDKVRAGGLLVAVTAAMLSGTFQATADPSGRPPVDETIQQQNRDAAAAAADKGAAGFQDDFINVAGPAAQVVMAEYQVPASVTVGQAINESDWGRSGLSTRDKNYFGMKCGSATNPGPIAISCRKYATQECDSSGCHTVDAYFRVFASMTDSFRDYGATLRRVSVYAPAFQYTNNPDQFIREVGPHYATDPNYANKIINYMRTYDLYRFNTGGPLSVVGPMFHEIRSADGQSWTGFQPLSGYQTSLPGDAKDMSIAAMPDGSAQVLIVGADDRVYHEIRNADGQSWTGLQPLAGKDTTEPAAAKRVAITGMPDGSAQVLIVGWDNVVYHEIRNANGTWTGFQPLSGYNTPNPAGAKDVAIAGLPDGSAQVLIIGADDRVYHEIRSANGQSWTGFQPLPGYQTTSPAGGKRVSIAGMADGSAQVLIVGADDRVYHEIRNASGTWTGFQPLPGYQTPDPAAAKDVAITGTPDGAAQVLIVGWDNHVYHEIRNADGLSWTGFQPLAGNGTTDPAGGSAVSIAGMPDGAAQVVIVGQRR